ncbi:MAG: aldose 1-epimerase family protein [Planctomycetes bacterium]|nr:aldose 1-epimerase family protein [Planctomycetota bacterium]
MKRFRTWTLTDVVNDVWLENFSTGSDRLQLGPASDWSIRKRTLRGGYRDGLDLIEVNNGALSYSILPTRGMGLWHGRYHGIYLGWKAPVHGPVHPRHVNTSDRGGIGWLTGFDEWLCRCGLASNGPPGDDVYTDRAGQTRRDLLPLHGRIANQPAYYVEVRVGLDPPYELSVTGQVEEGGLFYPHLVLTTTYTTVPGSNRVVIHDHVENRGAQVAEMQLLYHCNLGQPLLDAGSRVALPIREVSPISPRAAEGIATLDTYAGPTTGFAEQVYCCDLLADTAGRSLAMLYTHAADRGIVLRFNLQELPCFTVWKNSGALEDGYVTGLEPATNYPNFKTFERQQGRVMMLPAAGHWEATWSVEVHDTSAAVTSVLAEIVSVQAQAKAIVHRTPQSKYSSAARPA